MCTTDFVLFCLVWSCVYVCERERGERGGEIEPKGVLMEVRRNFGVNFLLLPLCLFQELNSGPETPMVSVTLPSGKSHLPLT